MRTHVEAGRGQYFQSRSTTRRDRIGEHEMFSRLWLSGGDPGTKPVVLVHGLSMSSSYFLPTAAQLAASGFLIYSPDLPGFGRSGDPGRSLNLDELAFSLQRWLEHVQAPPAAMVANSLGCNVLVNLALRCPELVTRMVLIGPTLDPWARSYPRVIARAGLNMLYEPLSFWRIILADYLAGGMRRTVVTLGYGLEDRPERKLPGIPIPALVVRGEHDRIISARWAKQVADSLPDGRLATIPGAAHVVNFSHPRRLAAAIIPFLREEHGQI